MRGFQFTLMEEIVETNCYHLNVVINDYFYEFSLVFKLKS